MYACMDACVGPFCARDPFITTGVSAKTEPVYTLKVPLKSLKLQ